MKKTKYRCPYIKESDKLCDMSLPCGNCVQFSPDYLEKILTANNNAMPKCTCVPIHTPPEAFVHGNLFLVMGDCPVHFGTLRQ